MSGNQALNTNADIGGTADLAITDHGSNWYWAVTAIMAVSTLIFAGLSFTRPRTSRLFHYITAAITLVAAIAYFSMAANLGQTQILTEFPRPNSNVVYAAGTREIFYVRYIDWAITTPLLLIDLLLTAAVPWPTILITILVDEVMIVTGLVGALTRSSYKWGYWVFGTAALLFVVYQLVFVGRRHANHLGGAISTTFTRCGVLTIFVWFLYPIAWGLSEGGNVIHPDSEAIFYGILDIIAKPVFGALLLLGHRRIEPADIGLAIRDYDHPLGSSTHHGEKHHNGLGNNGHSAGVTNADPVV